jgi:hypothetical protein
VARTPKDQRDERRRRVVEQTSALRDVDAIEALIALPFADPLLRRSTSIARITRPTPSSCRR